MSTTVTKLNVYKTNHLWIIRNWQALLHSLSKSSRIKSNEFSVAIRDVEVKFKIVAKPYLHHGRRCFAFKLEAADPTNGPALGSFKFRLVEKTCFGHLSVLKWAPIALENATKTVSILSGVACRDLQLLVKIKILEPIMMNPGNFLTDADDHVLPRYQELFPEPSIE